MSGEGLGAPFQFPVAVIGGAALDAVNEGGQGSVLAVFRRSFYVACGPGRLACLGPPSLGAGPLNALCRLPDGLDWAASGLRADLPVRLAGDALRVGERFRFPLAGAHRWRPPPPPPGWTSDDLASGLGALADAARRCAPDEGLAPLVPALCGGREAAAIECAGEHIVADGFRRAAAPGIMGLCRWMEDALAGGRSAVPAAVARLIGLGPGLTPSGDDCLGGAMVALHLLGRSDVAARLAGWAEPLARRGTGRISVAHLVCAAAGEGSAALMDLLSALLRPGSAELTAGLAAIDGIGHSSGWDALAGAAAACAAYCAVSGKLSEDR